MLRHFILHPSAFSFLCGPLRSPRPLRFNFSQGCREGATECSDHIDVRMEALVAFVSHVIRRICDSSLSICLIFAFSCAWLYLLSGE